MYEDVVRRLRKIIKAHKEIYGGSTEESVAIEQAADAIEEMNKRIDFLMNCIYEAEDSLDRGEDNDWARAALEKAERGQDDV